MMMEVDGTHILDAYGRLGGIIRRRIQKVLVIPKRMLKLETSGEKMKDATS